MTTRQVRYYKSRPAEAACCSYCRFTAEYYPRRWSFGRCSCGGLKRQDGDAEDSPVVCQKCGKAYPKITAKVVSEAREREAARRECQEHERHAHRARKLVEDIRGVMSSLRHGEGDESLVREYYRLLCEWWAMPPSDDFAEAQKEVYGMFSEREPSGGLLPWKQGTPRWHKAVDRARAEGAEIRLFA